MAKVARTSKCGKAETRVRLATARAYLEVAVTVLDEPTRDEFRSVTAGTAVLAGIAASDAICCVRLGQVHRGDDHRQAAELLKGAVPDGPKLAATLARLLDVKGESHYGLLVLSARKAHDAVRWAETLVARAQDEVER
jgi:hypothetical protein